jgi:hypothetical protein
MHARLRAAVDASVGWYEDLCALHGVGSVLRDGLWSSTSPPPPLHSDAEVVEPTVTAEQILERLDGRAQCGVKDSFGTLDLSSRGMDLLFSATWIHRPAATPAVTGAHGWEVVQTVDDLAEWTAGHDTAAVLLPGLLERAHFTILAKRESGRIVAGAVARLGSGTVDVSNVHAAPGHSVDWAELARVIQWHYPGRQLVGYERGDDLAAAIEGGFQPVGDLRVWMR